MVVWVFDALMNAHWTFSFQRIFNERTGRSVSDETNQTSNNSAQFRNDEIWDEFKMDLEQRKTSSSFSDFVERFCNTKNRENGNEMKTKEQEYFVDEMTALKHHQEASKAPTPLEPTTAKYLLDFIYLTRDDEQFRFYKKVSCVELCIISRLWIHVIWKLTELKRTQKERR